jgi:hypothetical protein
MVNIMVQWLMTGFISLIHPFYIAMVEINHNANEKTVEISVRVFTEDFEKTLQKKTTTRLDIIKPSDNAFLDKQISNYLTEKIKIKVNGQPVALSYIGHEVQNESVWSYLEIPKVPNVKKIEIDCSLLYDYEKAQSNIIHVKNGKAEKSYKLDYPKNSAIFDF